MKFHYHHIRNFFSSEPSIDEISNSLFQLGHEHEVQKNIFDVEITPNRGDCLSLIGLIRDMSPFFDVNLDLEIYEDSFNEFKFDFINDHINACSNISFLKVEVDDLPKSYKGELKDYYDDLAIKKNNFFTDISNYIAYEMGQPTHCYDAEKIKSLKLEYINTNEEFESLLRKKIKLNGKNLIFSHQNKIVNLAGVMGDLSTSCSQDTKSVIIECAYFRPEFIIGKSLKYGIQSEAAYKFERGTDPTCHEKVLRRFAQIVKSHVKINNIEFINKDSTAFQETRITRSVEKINQILGLSLSQISFEAYLDKLGFRFNDNYISVPSFRSDVVTQHDIAEEIARVIGYDNINSVPFNIVKSNSNESDFDFVESSIKNYLNKRGFYEVINNPFVASKSKNSILIDNPLDSTKKFIRTNLKESLLENLLYNERRQKDTIKLFEISDIYDLESGVEPHKTLGIICTGRLDKNYKDFSKKIDFAYLEDLLSDIFPTFDRANISNISRETLDTKLKDKIFYSEFKIFYQKVNDKYLSNKKDIKTNFIKYSPISEFPRSSRDLSFAVKSKKSYQELLNLIESFNHEFLIDKFIFDFFKDKKNEIIKIGYRFTFQSNSHTLNEFEINQIIEEIIQSSCGIETVSIPGININK